VPVDREGTREADFASRAEGMAPAQAIEIVWSWFALNWEDRDIPFARSRLGCMRSLPALTPSRSDPSLSDGSGACGVRSKALPSHVPSPSIHGTRPSTGALKNMKKLPLALAAPGSHYGTAAAFRRERPSVAGRPGCPRRFGSGRARRGLTGPQRAALCVLRAGGLRPAPALAVMLWPTANRSIEAPAIRR